jgi:hypothetical protein
MKNLLDEIVKGAFSFDGPYVLPEGCDTWGIRSVRPDMRSSRRFRWPYPGGVAKAPGPIDDDNSDACPSHIGDGICLAGSWRGMAQTCIPSITLLLVAYAAKDVLGADLGDLKFRVAQCHVVDVIDGARLAACIELEREYRSGLLK